MPSWPATLPQYVNQAGYAEQFNDQTIESAVDAGPAKVRRRFTSFFRRFQVSIDMDPAQADEFETFYLTTLAGGTIPFDWVHPRTRVATTFRFRKPQPQFMVLNSGAVIRATFTLETLP